MLARANDLVQARRRPRTICLGLDSMAQRRELFIAYLAACVVGARAVEDARSFLVDSTPEQWEHAQAELARSAERMRDLSSPRRRLTGTCSCSCADDDATVKLTKLQARALGGYVHKDQIKDPAFDASGTATSSACAKVAAQASRESCD